MERKIVFRKRFDYLKGKIVLCATLCSSGEELWCVSQGQCSGATRQTSRFGIKTPVMTGRR